MKLFVGIDVSSQELEACFMKADGDTLETFKVENHLHSASHLRDCIIIAADKLSSSEIHIGLEHITAGLSSHERQAAPPIVVERPASVNRTMCRENGKKDRRDEATAFRLPCLYNFDAVSRRLPLTGA